MDTNGNGAGVRFSRVVEELGFDPWTEERAAANNRAMDRFLAQCEREEAFEREQARCRHADTSAVERAKAYLAKCPPAVSGQQGHNTAYAIVRAIVWGFDLGPEAGFEVIKAHYNPTCLPEWSDAELRHKCKDADTKPFDKPRGYLLNEENGRTTPSANGVRREADRKPKVKPGQSVVVRASEVEPREVEWLWPGRIPLGKLTTFAGVGGLGKTFVLCDITARVTRGSPWPDAGSECREPGQVLFVSGEDDPDDTLVPRLIELGADLSRVCFLRTEVSDTFTLADLDTLDEALRQTGSGVRFVAIDPPTAYLGGVNDHKNAELRGLLGPLKSWAARNRLAVVFNTHVNKPQGAKVDAMMRVMGSVAWVNAVRAAHMFARDPDDRDRRLCIPMKNNLGPEQKGLAYRLAFEPGKMARVEWLGEVDTTADEAINNAPDKPRRVVAAEWLVDRFREKREWPSDELFRAAKEENLSRDAIFEAKRKLDLPRARKVTGSDGSVTWYWWVPEDWKQLAQPDEVEL